LRTAKPTIFNWLGWHPGTQYFDQETHPGGARIASHQHTRLSASVTNPHKWYQVVKIWSTSCGCPTAHRYVYMTWTSLWTQTAGPRVRTAACAQYRQPVGHRVDQPGTRRQRHL